MGDGRLGYGWLPGRHGNCTRFGTEGSNSGCGRVASVVAVMGRGLSRRQWTLSCRTTSRYPNSNANAYMPSPNATSAFQRESKEGTSKRSKREGLKRQSTRKRNECEGSSPNATMKKREVKEEGATAEKLIGRRGPIVGGTLLRPTRMPSFHLGAWTVLGYFQLRRNRTR